MCWGREGTHGAWLVHLREREGKREAERAEGGACRSRSGRTVARRARRVRSTSIADTTTALTLEVRLCVGVEGMYLVGLVRRVEGTVRYPTAFFTIARLCRVIGLALGFLLLLHLEWRCPARPPPSMSSAQLVPRRAVAIVNAHEETVADGKKTIVIRRRPAEAREMLVEVREEGGVWL
ncbi:hypothetical protein C8R45DRAFT_1045470, partial [Mycena sanguinolenta]